ncbi:SAM-dependent methyltransferase [Streptomyces sp. CJ_13]|uniref:THUMP-like domain-containing protein n=1 Tax=Streptomyces sp. CJ_13 TaxID=2724943 RepID=UPI0027E27548|nr:SAM-dependent methyltransferase [Streptomyces sp. CJ_13]
MDLETFRALLTHEGQTLLAVLQDVEPALESVTVADLRHEHPAELVTAAVEQVRLRRQAAAKFGELAPRLYFTLDSLELSSHLAVSEYKLNRVLDEVGVVLIVAMSLGSGVDALVLSWSHMTEAVDKDPLTIEITAANRQVMDEPMLQLNCADITGFDSQGEAVFIDLMRRVGPGEGRDPETYYPPLSWALDRVRTTGAGWIRLAPSLPDEAVPDLGQADQAEWISYDGEIQEAVLWFGLLERRTPLPTPLRKATLLPCGASLAGRGLPGPAVRPVGRYLYEPDPAVVYARLVAEVAQDVAGGLVDEGGALITADELHDTPFATAYEITNILPFNRAALRATLRERAVGRVEVAGRGLGSEPDEFQLELAPQNPDAATAFITGTPDRPTVLIASPIPDTPTP